MMTAEKDQSSACRLVQLGISDRSGDVSLMPQQQRDALVGFVHASETCGAADGPGVRYVVFLQGCPLRCLYCHNPETQALRRGHLRSVGELVADVKRYRSYFRASGGGMTVSGGEPLLQPLFVEALLAGCREAGIHTALDTAGHAHLKDSAGALREADLVLLDLKAFDPQLHRRITGVGPERVQQTAHFLAEISKPVWVRYVLVPGLTDDAHEIAAVARFAAKLGNVQRVDVLPFHQMGEAKWRRLGLPYALGNTLEPTSQQVEEAVAIFRQYGLVAW